MEKGSSRPPKVVQGSRMPEVTLTLPAILGLLAVFLIVGAGLVYVALGATKGTPVAAADGTVTATITLTPTASVTSTPETPTPTNTPMPSPTPQVYTVKLGDTCGGIAYAFGVSINSIVLINNLPADCGSLSENQQLFIPAPTPTATAMPTATLSAAEATEAACQKVEYTVQEGDTLGKIAANYAVPKEAISEYNGLVNDVVRFNQQLIIPLCKRSATPGPTPTATPPPPYQAPNPLLPPDGQYFTTADEVVTLQWAAVGALRENEAYAISLEDVTSGSNEKQVEYLTDTKYIVPARFRPTDGKPHAIRWFVLTVRQVGTDEDGNPLWEQAGAVSEARVFLWAAGEGEGGAPAVSDTPAP